MAWKRLFAKREAKPSSPPPGTPPAGPAEGAPLPSGPVASGPPAQRTSSRPAAGNRRVRVFVSSTFRDMAEDRDELMSQAWPKLRRF